MLIFLARSFQENGIADNLIKLDAEGFKISEGDPLLNGIVDQLCGVRLYGKLWGGSGTAWCPSLARRFPAGNGSSTASSGGSSRSSQCLGFLSAWSSRCARQIGQKRGAHFVSPQPATATRDTGRLQSELQFRHFGPILAAIAGTPVEPSLVNFYTLDTMRSPPHPHVTSTRQFRIYNNRHFFS